MSSSCWLATFTGKKVYPLEPRPEQFCIEDIAHHLSNMCRFAGATGRFYSVAQHCVLIMQQVPDDCKKFALLHDASEAYICDLPAPLKHCKELDDYCRIEDKMTQVILQALGDSDTWSHNIYRTVKQADMRMRQTEAEELGVDSSEWGEHFERYDLEITPWSPIAAKAEFLWKWAELNK